MSSDFNSAGLAEAFRFVATASGTGTVVNVYLDASSQATQVIVGLYGDNGAGAPGNLLALGVVTAPVAGTWNAATIPSTLIGVGTTYWIAVLSPSNAGAIAFRDTGNGQPSVVSALSGATDLPSIWQSGTRYPNSPISAYVTTGP